MKLFEIKVLPEMCEKSLIIFGLFLVKKRSLNLDKYLFTTFTYRTIHKYKYQFLVVLNLRSRAVFEGLLRNSNNYSSLEYKIDIHCHHFNIAYTSISSKFMPFCLFLYNNSRIFKE